MAYEVGRCLLRDLIDASEFDRKSVELHTNMSRQQLTDYISGRNTMSLPIAREFAALFDCHIEDLYEWRHVKSRRRRKG